MDIKTIGEFISNLSVETIGLINNHNRNLGMLIMSIYREKKNFKMMERIIEQNDKIIEKTFDAVNTIVSKPNLSLEEIRLASQLIQTLQIYSIKNFYNSSQIQGGNRFPLMLDNTNDDDDSDDYYYDD